MIGAGMDDWDGSKIVKMPSGDIDRSLSLISPFISMMGGGKTLRTAPPIIAESDDLSVFPRHGLLCGSGQRRRLEGGGRCLPQPARCRPNRSSTPKSSAPSPTCPRSSNSASSSLAAPWKEFGRNVLGEMQTRSCSGPIGGKAAPPAGTATATPSSRAPRTKLGLVWLSTWDSDDDAQEFAQAYTRYQTTANG